MSSPRALACSLAYTMLPTRLDVLALLSATVLMACGGGETPTERITPLARSVQLQPDSTGVMLGQSVQLTASVSADPGFAGSTAILWRTSNTDVATVSDAGTVSGRSVGVATITAKAAADTTIARSAKVSVSGFLLKEVSAAGAHTCGLTADGTAYCWGENAQGELGRGSVSTGESVPRPVAGTVKFSRLALASGSMNHHMCAISLAGDAYCWGDNSAGQLGTGSTTSSAVPVMVTGGIRFRQIAVGAATCGVSVNDEGYCWGRGTAGQIGNGGNTNQVAPVPIMPGTRLQSLTTTDYHSCALAVGGAVHCWGVGEYGQLGTGTTTGSTVPRAIMSSEAFVAVEAERFSTCALTAGGATYCWGDIVGVHTLAPTRIRADQAFAEIAGAGWLTCGRKATGEVYCWGPVAGSQLGQGAAPVVGAPVAGGLRFNSISVGSEYMFEKSQYACGTTDLGAVCWGVNTNGSLGTASAGDASAPTAVQMP